MFKKRSKKGLSHVDWAISLGIFLLYLGWFFIFVKPLFSPASSMGVLLDILDDVLDDQMAQGIERIKVFVPDNIDYEYYPVAIPFTEDWAERDVAHSEDYFEIDEGRMFFLANLSEKKMFRMYHPLDVMIFTPPSGIIANEDRTTSGVFTARFNEFMLSSILYDNDYRIWDFYVEVDETELDDEGSFWNSTFISKYQRSGDLLNLTTYAFAENSMMYSYIVPADYRNHSITIDFTVFNYTDFYFDPVNYGDLSYSIMPSCRYYDSDFLDLYNSQSGLMIKFSREIDIRLCTNETNPSVRLEFDSYAGEEDTLTIFTHPGNVADVIDYPANPIVGVTETLRTVSKDKIGVFKNKDYDYLKQIFGYPKDRDFNITITSDIIDASYGIEQPPVADIYAKKIEEVIIDGNYEPKRALITLTVW